MSEADTLSLLWDWTPYLAGGFLVNLLITANAMLLGTVIGMSIGALRSSRFRPVRLSARATTATCRNIPSFVLMFYLAFMVPSEIVVGASVVAVPAWIKASVALDEKHSRFGSPPWNSSVNSFRVSSTISPASRPRSNPERPGLTPCDRKKPSMNV